MFRFTPVWMMAVLAACEDEEPVSDVEAVDTGQVLRGNTGTTTTSSAPWPTVPPPKESTEVIVLDAEDTSQFPAWDLLGNVAGGMDAGGLTNVTGKNIQFTYVNGTYTRATLSINGNVGTNLVLERHPDPSTNAFRISKDGVWRYFMYIGTANCGSGWKIVDGTEEVPCLTLRDMFQPPP